MNARGRVLIGLLVGGLLVGGWGSRATTAGAVTSITSKGVKGSITARFSWTTDPAKKGTANIGQCNDLSKNILGKIECEDCETTITFNGGTVDVSGKYEYMSTDTSMVQKSDGEHTIVRELRIKGDIPKTPANVAFNYTVDRHYVFGYGAYQVSYFQPRWDAYLDAHTTDNGKEVGDGASHPATVGCANPKQHLVNILRIEGTVKNANAVHFSGTKTSDIKDTNSFKIVGTYTLHWDLTVPAPANPRG